MRKYILLLLLIAMSTSLSAQLRIPKAFQQALDQADLSLAIPTENRFKKLRLRRNDIFNCDFAMRSRKGKLEIRYALVQSDFPHVSCAAVAASIADNEGDAPLAIHDISAKELKEQFHADWGAIVYFQPKPQFSNKKHAKLLALYRQGKGMIYAFYLFDEISEELEQQQYQLQFEE